jgi:hypothetical protein
MQADHTLLIALAANVPCRYSLGVFLVVQFRLCGAVSFWFFPQQVSAAYWCIRFHTSTKGFAII